MHSIENHIMSAIMLTSDNMAAAIERGMTEDWLVENKAVWNKVLVAYSKGEWNGRNSVTVLQRHGVFSEPGALELCQDTPAWAHRIEEVHDALEVMAGEYATRIALDTSKEGMNRLIGGADPFEVASSMSSELIQVDNLFSSGNNRTTRDIAKSALEIDEKIASGECVGLPFPWYSFQQKTFGIPFKAVTPLGGRDGKGKSRLATYLTCKWVEEGIPILYFAFEDSAERMFSNCCASYGGYDMFSIKRGNHNPNFLPKHRETMDAVSEMPLYIEDCPCSAERLVSIIANHKRKHGIKGVVVDGLKDMILTGDGNQTERETRANAVLVRAAKKYDVAILAISHLTDLDDEAWISKRNIRGSKTQSQSARMALMYQDAGFPSKVIETYGGNTSDYVILDCQKASYGDRGTVALIPELEKGRFVDISPMEKRDYEEEKRALFE